MTHMTHAAAGAVLLLLSSAQAQYGMPTVTAQINAANGSVMAYLPDLQNVTLAQSLKATAQKNIPVTILTTRKAHMIRGSYLLSVALSNAQTPPKPLRYGWVNLNSPPLVVIDQTTVYYGQGLISGAGSIQKGSASFAQKSYRTLSQLANQSAPVPARTLVEERFGLTPVPKPNL